VPSRAEPSLQCCAIRTSQSHSAIGKCGPLTHCWLTHCRYRLHHALFLPKGRQLLPAADQDDPACFLRVCAHSPKHATALKRC
jgi:hypothetical protein